MTVSREYFGDYIFFNNKNFKIDGIIIYSPIDNGKKCILYEFPSIFDTWKKKIPKERLPILPNPYLSAKESWGFYLEISDPLKDIRELDEYEKSLKNFIEWILKHPNTKTRKEHF